MTKVVSLVTSYPSQDAKWIRIEAIANELKNEGFDVTFVHLVPECNNIDSVDDCGFVHIYRKCNKASSPISAMKQMVKLRPDIIYGNTQYGTAVSSLGKLKGIPVIFDMHGDIINEFLLESKANGNRNVNPLGLSQDIVLQSLSCLVSDHIIAVSNGMKSYLCSKGMKPENISVIPNGVYPEKIKNDPNGRKIKRDLIGVDDNELLFGYIGSDAAYQGLPMLIDAIPITADQYSKYLILGATSKKCNDKRCINIGRVRRDEILAYYSACDVFLIPRPRTITTEVAFPTKFAEYAAVGKPIISTDVGDVPKYIKKWACGHICEPNHQSIASSIDNINNLSALEINRMGLAAREMAESELSWNRISPILVRAIEKCLS